MLHFFRRPLLTMRPSETNFVLCLQGYLLDAVRASPCNSEAWYQLGLVNKALGQSEAAKECLEKSLGLKTHEPILSFDNIPFIL